MFVHFPVFVLHELFHKGIELSVGRVYTWAKKFGTAKPTNAPTHSLFKTDQIGFVAASLHSKLLLN